MMLLRSFLPLYLCYYLYFVFAMNDKFFVPLEWQRMNKPMYFLPTLVSFPLRASLQFAAKKCISKKIVLI